MVFSILTRKSQVPRHSCCPPEAQVLAKRRQASAGGSHRPGPETLPSGHCWGSQVDSRPQLARRPQATQIAEIVPHAAAQADGRCHQGTEAGMSRGPLPPEGRPGPDRWAALARALEPSEYSLPACSLKFLLRQRAGGLGRNRIHHFSLLPDNHHSADHWLNDPLTFAHWQLVILGGEAHCGTDWWLSRSLTVSRMDSQSLGGGCSPWLGWEDH